MQNTKTATSDPSAPRWRAGLLPLPPFSVQRKDRDERGDSREQEQPGQQCTLDRPLEKAGEVVEHVSREGEGKAVEIRPPLPRREHGNHCNGRFENDRDITNCQIGVFAAYVSRHGHAFIDRALYLPKGWTDDPARLKATYVPGDIGFSTKPQLAAEMIERALAAGVPFRWVAADSVYGVGDIERDLRQAGKGYVLGVNSNHWFASWGKPQRVVGTAEEIAKTQRRSDWRRLSAGAGTKGPRLHDWCYLELADLEGEESNHHSQVLWTRGLLIRRNIANGDLAYFTTWCPAGTSIKTLVSVEGHRWAIEDPIRQLRRDRSRELSSSLTDRPICR